MSALVALLLNGCAKPAGTYEVAKLPTEAVASETVSTLKAEADAAWAGRGDKAQLQVALQKYEALYATNPSDREVAMRLLRGWYFLGDGHETEKEAQLAAWSTAIEWGKKCLAINTEFTALLAKGDETEATAARAFQAPDVPCLYWTSSSLGKWAKLSGIGTTLKHLPTVKAYMSKVGELEPTYYYSGPDRYWGAYYSAIPSFAGQDLGRSRDHFDKAIAAYPDFLGTHVLLAGEWAVKKQDKETFERELNWVLQAPTDRLPEVQPEMEAEKRKATALLAREGDLFAN
jgi:hypothetical protein